jgi:ATP-dependent 26S proteasome regulatory subunit
MIATALIACIISLLPIEDYNVKMNIGLLLSAIVNSNVLERLTRLFRGASHIDIPEFSIDRRHNPLYMRMHDYLIYRFIKQIDNCELHARNGDIEIEIKTTDKLIDHHHHNNRMHTISLCVDQVMLDNISMKRVRIKCKTLSADEIRGYVHKVSAFRLLTTNIIKVNRPCVKITKEETIVDWERLSIRTNKTLENTIYSDDVIKDVFDDVHQFINNEDWYAKRGIPYKRGYFLHSTPGQGKTSIAKIIANKYNLPIFSMDLSVIDSNSTLNRLITDINYFTNNEKYILLMEDIDRNDFFTGPATNITMDAFLNVIDGIFEPNGRILIMTANDPEKILANTALTRPGRIDVIKELTDCDRKQLEALYKIFYGVPINILNHRRMSAAVVMKHLQDNRNTPELFLQSVVC